MSDEKLTTADYPLAENRPDLIRGPRGADLRDLTLEALVEGAVTLEDLRITPDALRYQAEISRSANRGTLGDNFERASELVDVPQAFIMSVYELLRPGRAANKDALLEAAATLRDKYGASRMAEFVEEAAAVYERRGLFTYRF